MIPRSESSQKKKKSSRKAVKFDDNVGTAGLADRQILGAKRCSSDLASAGGDGGGENMECQDTPTTPDHYRASASIASTTNAVMATTTVAENNPIDKNINSIRFEYNRWNRDCATTAFVDAPPMLPLRQLSPLSAIEEAFSVIGSKGVA